MLVEAPQLLYSLDAVLGKGKGKAATSVTPSHFFSQLWLRVTPNGDRIFWLGTSTRTGARELLLDSHAISRIQQTAAFQVAPSAHPAAAFTTLVEYHAPTTKRLRAKMATLRLENRKRVRKHAARWSELGAAKDWLERRQRAVLAVCVAAHEGARRGSKKVLEIGWARWVPDGSADVDELARALETSMTFELNPVAKAGHQAGRSRGKTLKKVEATGASIRVAHAIIEENQHVRNGRFVPDRRDEFSFGCSTLLPYETALASLRAILDSPRLALVGNALHFPVATLGLQTQITSAEILTFDIGKLYRTARRDNRIKSTLADLLEYYSVPHDTALMHNAGNDALYILQAFLAQAAAEPRA